MLFDAPLVQHPISNYFAKPARISRVMRFVPLRANDRCFANVIVGPFTELQVYFDAGSLIDRNSACAQEAAAPYVLRCRHNIYWI